MSHLSSRFHMPVLDTDSPVDLVCNIVKSLILYLLSELDYRSSYQLINVILD